jgi:hypothetical protein
MHACATVCGQTASSSRLTYTFHHKCAACLAAAVRLLRLSYLRPAPSTGPSCAFWKLSVECRMEGDLAHLLLQGTAATTECMDGWGGGFRQCQQGPGGGFSPNALGPCHYLYTPLQQQQACLGIERIHAQLQEAAAGAMAETWAAAGAAGPRQALHGASRPTAEAWELKDCEAVPWLQP